MPSLIGSGGKFDSLQPDREISGRTDGQTIRKAHQNFQLRLAKNPIKNNANYVFIDLLQCILCMGTG